MKKEKLYMCKRYILGSTCLRTCPFAHGSHEFSMKVPLCHYDSKCQYLNLCQWRHTKSLGRNIDMLNRSGKDKLCSSFLRGDCNNQFCPLAHGSHQFSVKIPCCRFNKSCHNLNACQWRHTIRHGHDLNIIDWKPSHKNILVVGCDTPKKEVHVILALVFKKNGLPICRDIINLLIEHTVKMTPFKDYYLSCKRPDKKLGDYKILRINANKDDSELHINGGMFIKRYPTIFEAIDADQIFTYWYMTYRWWRT